MNEEKYISVDIETTGLIIGEDNIASIGACIVGNTKDNFYIELQPFTDKYRQKSVDVCGLTIEYLKENGVDQKYAMKKFAEWIDKHGRCVFVGFNAPFDYGFTNQYFLKYDLSNPFGINGLDMKGYYMGMMGCDWSETTKKKLLPAFKPTKRHTHNALDDAIEQAEIFEQMLTYRKTML